MNYVICEDPEVRIRDLDFGMCFDLDGDIYMLLKDEVANSNDQAKVADLRDGSIVIFPQDLMVVEVTKLRINRI